jgi:hypothetical protein
MEELVDLVGRDVAEDPAPSPNVCTTRPMAPARTSSAARTVARLSKRSEKKTE